MISGGYVKAMRFSSLVEHELSSKDEFLLEIPFVIRQSALRQPLVIR